MAIRCRRRRRATSPSRADPQPVARRDQQGSGRPHHRGRPVPPAPARGRGRPRALHVKLDHPEWEHVQRSARRCRSRSWPTPRCRWRLCNGGCFTKSRMSACRRGPAIVRGCRCSAEYIASVIPNSRWEERREMADADGLIQVDCAFCAKKFRYPSTRHRRPDPEILSGTGRCRPQGLTEGAST